jgi:hypothetical protein
MSAPAEPHSKTTPLTFSYYVYVEDRPRVLRPSRITAVITHSTYEEMRGEIHAVMREQNLWLDGRLSKPIVEGWFTIFAEAIGVAISHCRSPIGGNASTEIKTALHTFLNKHVLRDEMPDNIINQTLPNGNLPQQADVEARTEAYRGLHRRQSPHRQHLRQFRLVDRVQSPDAHRARFSPRN